MQASILRSKHTLTVANSRLVMGACCPALGKGAALYLSHLSMSMDLQVSGSVVGRHIERLLPSHACATGHTTDSAHAPPSSEVRTVHSLVLESGC